MLRTRWAQIGGILAATAGLGARTVLYPVDEDHALFAYGADVILKGEVLYQNLFDQKPPLIYLWTAGAFQIFGRTMVSIRLLDLVWQAVTAIVIGLIAHRLWPRSGTMLIAGTMYLFAYFQFSLLGLANADTLMSLPAAAALLIVGNSLSREQRPSRSGLAWFVAGAFIGATTLLKPTAIVILPSLILAAAFSAKSAPFRNTVRNLSIWTFGASCGLVTLVAGVLMLPTLRGGLDELWDLQMRLNPLSNYWALRTYGFSKVLQFASMHFPGRVLALVVPFGLVGVVLWSRADPRSRTNVYAWLVLGWLLAGIVCLVLQMRFFRYHYAPLLGPLSIFGAVAIGELLLRSRDWKHHKKAVALGMLFLSLSLPALRDYARDARRVLGALRDGLAPSYHRFEIDGIPFGELRSVADTIQHHTAPDERIFVFGNARPLYFMSGRFAASRFILTLPLAATWTRQQDRHEFTDAILRSPPKVFVVCKRDVSFEFSGLEIDSAAVLRTYPEVQELLSARYRRIEVRPSMDVWLRL